MIAAEMARGTRSVCLLTTFYPPYHFGGDAVYVQRLAHALADRGDRVTVVHCTDSHRILAHGAAVGPVETHEGVTVVSLAGRLPLLSPLVTYLSGRMALKARTLRALFASERFDVVHFHNISLLGASVLGLGTGVKLYTLHDQWLVCPMHVLWKDNREPCVTPSCFRCGLAFRRPPQPWRATGLLEQQLAHVDRFVAPSDFTLDAHRERGLELPASVVPSFVPDAAPSNDRARSASSFLYVGRLERIKGVETLIDAFATAPELQLVIAGTGTQEAALREQAADCGNIAFVGRLDDTALGDLYYRSAALILPSTGYESGPLVIAEAFAHGTPVVGRRLGGVVAALEQSAGGFLYATNDELVAILRRLAGDAALRAEAGAGARASYVEHHTVDAHLAALDEIVDDVLRARPTPRASSLSAG